MADLHWSGPGHEPRGFLSSGSPQNVTPAGGVFVFEIPVPARPNLQHIRAIICLGPTVRWVDRQKAVETEEIPVQPAGSDPDRSALKPLGTHEISVEPAVPAKEARWPRPMNAALWFAAGTLAWRACPSESIKRKTVVAWLDHGRLWLAVACWAAALFEFSQADLYLAARSRAYAQEHGVYFERRWLQQTATGLALGGAAIAALVAARRIKSPARSVAVLSLEMFAAVSLAGSFSLHQLDQAFALQMGPLLLGQLIKLSLAMTAVFAVWPREH